MERFDVVVIGAGPGGYVAAIRAAQLGLKTALLDKDAALGGTCLNVGCIPSKALLDSSHRFAEARGDQLAAHGVVVGDVALDLGAMMARKVAVVTQLTDGVAGLMKKNKVTVVHGVARLAAADRVVVTGADGGATELEASHVILATGSEPMPLSGVPFDGDRIVSSTEALAFAEVPEHLVVVGAGAIGLELGSVWRRLGAAVTVVELLPRIAPAADAMVARLLQRALEAEGLEFRLGTTVKSAAVAGGRVTLTVEGAKGETHTLDGDRVLVAIGRRPYTAGLGLDALGVALERGRVVVDAHLMTSVPNVYAIGDLVAGPMLAHKAEDEGIAVAEHLAGRAGHVDYGTIPNVIYTHPELAQVGITEEEAKADGRAVTTGRFYFRANGRALASGDTDGVVKIIADAETDTLLGVHVLGAHASELIAEAVTSMSFGGSAEDCARTVHAHPTLSEAVREAALAVDGRAIHA